MDIGCHLPTQGPVATREALMTFAQEAERRNVASLWVSDHVVFPRHQTGSYPGGRFPHPPIWVGGDSPGAFRRVVTLGDGWHATSKTPAELKEALGRLRAAADKAGRAFETIELSIRFALRDELLAQGAQAVVDQLAAYKQLGLSHVAIDFRRDYLGKMLEILDLVTGKIRPAVDAA